MTEAPSHTKQVAISTAMVEKVMLMILSARITARDVNFSDQTAIWNSPLLFVGCFPLCCGNALLHEGSVQYRKVCVPDTV